MNFPKKQNDDLSASKGLVLSLILAIISLTCFYIAAQTNHPIVKVVPADQRDDCDAPDPSIAKFDAEIRGSTQAEPWVIFDQTKPLKFAKRTEKTTNFVPGGKVISMRIATAGQNPHDIGMSMLNQRKIEKETWVKAEVWLRAEALPGNKAPIIIEAKLQDNEDGFRTLVLQKLNLTTSYLPYLVTARTTRAYCPNDLNFAIHLATGAQIVDVGPATLTVSQPTRQ
jgi:hypothetical protein